jgi:hypothetical protein
MYMQRCRCTFDITPLQRRKQKMANQKNYYYVLVFTDEGPVYVTSVNNAHQTAHWQKSEVPLAIPKYFAEDLVLGLNLNYHHAVLVASKYKLSQPYNYGGYDCKFIEKS